MHAEAGLLALQALSLAEAEVHLRASTTLFEWSREAAARRGLGRGGEPRDFGRHARPRSGENRPPGLLRGPGRRGPRHRLPAHGLHPFAGEARAGRAARSRGPARVRLRGRGPRRGAAPPAPRVGGGRLARPGGPRAAGRARPRPGPAGGPAPPRQAPPRRGAARSRRSRSSRRSRRSSGDDRQRYLARLFLGRLAERRGRHDEAAGFYRRALEAWPDSQAARLALGHALERSSGPAAARPLVAASLAASQRLDRAADPWWLYPFGPPGLAKAALDRVWTEALDR